MRRLNAVYSGILSILCLALSASSSADWISRFATAGDVTGNKRFFSLVTGFPSECPIVAVANPTKYVFKVVTIRFINSRYIGAGDPNLDDWHITVRKTLGGVLGMTNWTSNAQVFRVGPPSQWSNFPGAFDMSGRPVQDTVLAKLERFNIVIPPRSVRYLGLANAASPNNGFTATMMTDWRVSEDDYGFVSTLAPSVKTISGHTADMFRNLAVNVEVKRSLSIGGG